MCGKKRGLLADDRAKFAEGDKKSGRFAVVRS